MGPELLRSVRLVPSCPHSLTRTLCATSQVSRLQFVDMPGAERLAMDPELLRLREGLQLNRSLLGFASVTRT